MEPPTIPLRPATRADIPQILDFIRGLAEYEKLAHEAVATPALLDRVTVNAYGNASTPLNQVASISNADAHSLLVTPFDKGMIKEIEKGLYNAEFTPNTLGTAIRINMPPPTEERRKELAKQVQKEGEGAKIAIRNIRQDANKEIAKLVKDKAISEDEKKRGEDDIQKLTDTNIKDVDKVVADKEKELLSV